MSHRKGANEIVNTGDMYLFGRPSEWEIEDDISDGDECVDKALMPLIDEGYEPDIRTNVEEG